MTISTTTNRVSFAGNGSTTAFATGFKFFANSDLTVVLITDSTGVEAVQTISTDYTVSGAGGASGGTVTMVTAPAVGETLVIVRAQPYTQGTDLVENDPFPSQTVEDQLDKIVIMTQQNNSAITRSLQQPNSDTVDIDRLPAKAARASKVLAFDADGDPEALTPNTDTYISLSTFMETVLDDTTAAAARTTLGVAIGSDVLAYNAGISSTPLEEGAHSIYIPASSMTIPTTSGAAAGSVETTTNKVMLDTLDFDASADEYAQFAIRMPKSWNEGTVTAVFTWSHPATTTNFGVAWGLQGVSFADGDAADAAYGTAVVATDTGGTTDDVYISPATGAVTIAGSPAAEEWVNFRILRDVSDAGDTMAVDARLHGVTVNITIDAGNDA